MSYSKTLAAFAAWSGLVGPLPPEDSARYGHQQGDDETIETCRARWPDVAPFRGCPYVPSDK